MKKDSEKKVVALPKTGYVVISVSGRICNLCGGHFEDDVCSSGHERGKAYPKQQK